MKIKLLFILFFSVWQVTFSQDVNFFTGTWQEAQAKAKAENKYIMVDAYAVWCGPCKRMDSEKFHGDPEVAGFINEHFVAYKVDCEKSPGTAIAMKFKVISYPTLLFFNPQGQLVSRMLGYNASPKLFLEPFQKAIEIKEKKVFAFDSKVLDPGFPDVYKNAFKQEGIAAKKPTIEEVLQYLDKQSDKYSETSWAVMYIYSFPGKYEQFFIDNYKKYYSLYKSEAEEAIRKMASARANMAMKNKDEAAMDSAVAMMEKYVPDRAKELVPIWKISFYQSTEQWKKFAAVIDQQIKNDTEPNQQYINQFCRTIYLRCDDQEVIKQALGWMDNIAPQMRNYDILDTYASLLYKGNRYNEAEQYAMKAIEAGESDDTDVENTKALLQKIRAAKN